MSYDDLNKRVSRLEAAQRKKRHFISPDTFWLIAAFGLVLVLYLFTV